MSIDETTEPEGGDVHLAGTIETDVEVVGEPKSANGELVDMVTEATWNDALSSARRFTKQPLTPLDDACNAHHARGRRWGARSATHQAFRPRRAQRSRRVRRMAPSLTASTLARSCGDYRDTEQRRPSRRLAIVRERIEELEQVAPETLVVPNETREELCELYAEAEYLETLAA